MTFSLEWGGRATDFAPELLKATGKPGRVAEAASAAVYEATQSIADKDASAWVKAHVTGWEGQPGLGRFVLNFEVLDYESSDVEDLVSEARTDD